MGDYLSISIADRNAEAYLAGDIGPGVLLYMDAIGLRPQIEQMAEHIASWGYVVLAPHVFWRSGNAAEFAPRIDLRLEENRQAFFASGVTERVQVITPDLARADADVWLDALQSLPGVSGHQVGVVGYCLGGRLALRTAGHRPAEVAVVGLFHTGGLVTDAVDSPHLELPNISAFVLAGHADADPSNTQDQITQFDAALSASGVRHQTATYPGARHGFTMADTSTYQEAGSERHYAELKEALQAVLNSSQ